ncbi:MAG: SGNH/GDSL hydrolase family protein [Paludibacter sp.]|nr:SGNH/GDSL hydrolase family protein [Paludibacter sp.]
MKKVKLISLLTCFALFHLVDAQKIYNPMGQARHVIWGHGYGLNSFSRFPADAQQTIPTDVWNQTLRSSGLHVRFVTNTSNITVNYTLTSQYSSNNWFSTVGANGVDLYARKPDGKWHWCHPGTRTIGSQFIYGSINPDETSYATNGYEYILYFPPFALTSSLTIAVDQAANFEFLTVSNEKKPIVVYGTSVVHGAVCSRPGNTWTSIVGRIFPDYPIVNLGFSGVGRMEPAVIDVINRIDAAIYILDCLPNFSNTTMPPLIDGRYKSAVDTLTKYHPDAAIILTEHFGYADMEMWKARKDLVLVDNIELKKVYDYFIQKGYQNLYYLSREELNLDMSADIGDYVHPNDKGMYRFAEVYSAKITEILNKQASSVKQIGAASLQIKPNPNNGSFTVTFPEQLQQQSVLKIFNMNGQTMYKEQINVFPGVHVIRKLNLCSGNYILALENNNQKLTEQFVIK